MTQRVIALIPAYNEAARVGEVVAGARPHVDEVVVIDDGSNDGTAAAAGEGGSQGPPPRTEPREGWGDCHGP